MMIEFLAKIVVKSRVTRMYLLERGGKAGTQTQQRVIATKVFHAV